nr:hypothetical protein [Tanacetum cinerariifolium]
MYTEYLAKFWYSAIALENSKVSFSIPTGGIYGEVGVNTFRDAIGVHYLSHYSEYVASPSIDIVRLWFEIIGYGETVPIKGTLKKSLLPPKWRLLLAHIIPCLQEYLAKFWYSAIALENSKVSFSIPTGGIYGEVGVNTFRDAIGVHYLSHYSEYVASPSIDIVRLWFEIIGYGETVPIKGTLKKSLLPPKWRLLLAHIIPCLQGKTGGFDQITNKDADVFRKL